MPFEIEEAVTSLTQHFNMSETEAVHLVNNVGKTYWSGMNGRWEVRGRGQLGDSATNVADQSWPRRGSRHV